VNKHLTIVDQAKATFLAPIEQDIANAFPSLVSRERFQTAFVIGVQNSPGILRCKPDTVKNALMKCAIDGLIPDGRLAALIPYGSDCTYVPMVQGIIRRAKELGEIFSLTCECVYENDDFDVDLADMASTRHKPPRLGKDRGEFNGAYVIFKDKDDRVIHREIMDADEIAKVQNFSKAKKGDLWTKWFSEAARKSVIRRGSKYVPMSDALRQIIEREDENFHFNNAPDVPNGKFNPLEIEDAEIVQPLDDLQPGVLADFVRALLSATDAPMYVAAKEDFWLNRPVGEDIDEPTTAKIDQLHALLVARIKFEIEPDDFEKQVREIVGVQEVDGSGAKDMPAGAAPSGKPEPEAAPATPEKPFPGDQKAKQQ
jgi:phage RecT family recombinase